MPKAAALDDRLQSIVAIDALVPDDAFTAARLGAKRIGSGVVIGEDGLVLTMGYLITEAMSVWLTTAQGRVLHAHPLAYDHESGFGLVQALEPAALPAIELGRSSEMDVGDDVVYLAGRGQFARAVIVGTQPFAGGWEYLIDDAIFTAPACPFWGGAGVIDADGRLIGVGSLLLKTSDETAHADMNMAVPIDLLPPILDDLRSLGRVNRPARPWLGAYSVEMDDQVVVESVASGGPAAAAGLRRGDIIAAVRDEAVRDQADFYRKIWSAGSAGVEIPIEIVRNRRSMWLRVKSADRAQFLKRPRVH
jgi:S1-C subfamily serine protease